MKPKIVPFKFRKKNVLSKGKVSRSKKNYENIFNDILSGKRNEKNSKNNQKAKNLEIKDNNLKKVKINFISKVEKLNLCIENIKLLNDKNIIKENKKNEKEDEIFLTDIGDKSNINNQINNYINKSNDEFNKHNIQLTEKYNNENNNIEANLIPFIKDKESISLIKDKQQNYIKSMKTMENENSQINNKFNLIKIDLNNQKKKATNVKTAESKSKKLNLYKNTISNRNINKEKAFNKKQKNSIDKVIESKNKKSKIYNNKTKSLNKINGLQYNNKKRSHQNNNNITKKITITNDNIKENKKEDYISIKNSVGRKKLIVNNTNSNINININITNINDKNSKKDNTYSSRDNTTHLITESNYNSNITTVNIINNNGIPKKISSNDCRLLFYNHSNKKYTPCFSKINSQGVKIESININLSEDENYNPNSINSKNQSKFKFKKNLKKYSLNSDKNCCNINLDSNNNTININNTNPNINEKKDAQSEYEHFRDIDDFLSSKSLTSYSCKSGFTASRKLRSLSRERDKIKMLNNLKNNDNKIDKIEDKLIKIVNKFHKDNSINNLNKNNKRKKFITGKKRKNNKYNTLN